MGKLVIVVIHTKKQHANVKIRILNIAPGDCTWWVPGFEVVTFSVCSLFFFFFFPSSLELSVFQAEQSQLSWPLLTWHLWPSWQPPWDSLRCAQISYAGEAERGHSTPDTGVRCGGPLPLTTSATPAQHAVGLLCHKGASLTHVQLDGHQDPRPFIAQQLSRQGAQLLLLHSALYYGRESWAYH